MRKKDKRLVGFFLLGMSLLFYLTGLLILLFATTPLGGSRPPLAPEATPSTIVTLANAIMAFILNLLQVEWTPTRVGIFLIIVGMILDAGGMYVFMVAGEKRG